MAEDNTSPGMEEKKTKSLKILCFGDSLTEGYTNYGLIFSPYSNTLYKVLQEALNPPSTMIENNDDRTLGREEGTEKEVVKKWDIQITTKGVSGQLVRDMERRTNGLYQVPKPYNLIIFLAGTNDLAYHRPALDILIDIKSTLSFPLSTGAKVLLMTVPECGMRVGWLDETPESVNSGLMEWAGERDDIEIFDLYAEMPYHSLSDSEREMLWDDQVHFTEAGYKQIGNSLGEKISSILKERPGWLD